jgi:aspartate 1-decarboxylase
LYYEGSITVDKALLDAADILPYEKVQVLNMNNGERMETYAIEGTENSGIICLNGPAARLAREGDEIIIITYTEMSDEEAKNHKPRIIIVDKNNKVEKILK